MRAQDPAQAAAELLVAQRPAIARAVGGIDHCILFTRMAVDVCRKRGIGAKALPVSVAMTADADPEVKILLGIEGHRPKDAPDDLWDGHLVAILDRRLLLDLSIDSVAQPELGLLPEPFVAEVSPDFAAGGTVNLPVQGGTVRYRAQPERRDYRSLPAWEQATDDEIARLADALLWPSDRPPIGGTGARTGA